MSSQFINGFVYLLVLLTTIQGCTNRATGDQRPPNIIYILADDLGYGDLGCYGQEKFATPNIDLLASGGVKFTQHYSGAPVCAPSRSVLLTGLHLGHTYIRGNDEWDERGDVWNFEATERDPSLEGQRPLPDSVFTIGKMLQAGGYTTGMVGKWGLGGPTTEGIPNNCGFDFFFGYNCQRQAHMLYPAHLWRNKEHVKLHNRLLPPRTLLDSAANPNDLTSYERYFQNEYAPELMHKEALTFIEENKDSPFFLYYASPIPHMPLQVPREHFEKYIGMFGEEEPYLGDKGYYPNRYPKAAYAAMVGYLDQQVGEIVEKLRELGLEENTLIIFTSDNGPTYNGGTNSPFFDSARPFKSEYGWGKGFVHEGGIRVPMIAYWKNKIKAGSTSNLISGFQDVLATLAEVAGVDVKVKTDGISFLAELLGKPEEQRQHEFLYWEFPEYNGQQALRMGRWKAIRKNINNGNLKLELFDLERDPLEQEDVANRFPEIVADMELILAREHTPSALKTFRMAALDSITASIP